MGAIRFCTGLLVLGKRSYFVTFYMHMWHLTLIQVCFHKYCVSSNNILFQATSVHLDFIYDDF